MRNKHVFATHMGVGNRGCEALTKSLCSLLGLSAEQTEIYSKYYKEDVESDIKAYGKILKINHWDEFSIWKKIACKIFLTVNGGKHQIELMKYDLTGITSDSVVYMTGGDLYCYEGTVKLMGFIHDYSVQHKATVMLIGCSIDETFLTEKVVDDLKRYDLITVRESMTAENLRKHGITRNVVLIPDSAFTLSPQPDGVDVQSNDDLVGINISKYVNNGEGDDTLFFRNIEKVIDYILHNTGYRVMLVPHVFWEDQDDRKLACVLKRKYITERVFILNSERLNYCQIRYAISKCKYFMGARTHSVISSYSECVPTVALGYSVKSAGIAKDLGMSMETVVDCRNLKNEDELVRAFKYLENNEKEIRNMLTRRLPSYVEEAKCLKKVVEKIYEKCEK